MNKFNELLEKLNGLNLIQTSIDWEECMPDEIWDEHFKGNYNPIRTGLNQDSHRWYETSISVIRIYDKLLGVKHITKLFSEMSSCEDCCVVIDFFEMEEVQVVSYKRKINL